MRMNTYVRMGGLLLGAVLLAQVLVAGEPSPYRIDGIDRVVVVGDVHGDYRQLVRTLRAASLIGAEGNWTGGQTHLVQMGDLFSRADDSRRALDLLMRLEQEAAAAGGAVHVLLGNHELMALQGQWPLMTEAEIASFGGPEQLAQKLLPDGLYGAWLRQRPIALLINGNLCVHGGLRLEVAERWSLDALNRTVREEMKLKRIPTRSPVFGPLWDRFYSLAEESVIIPELERVLLLYDADRMIVAHTVTGNGIMTRAGGRVIRVDVGMTGVYGGPAACLVIEDGVYREVGHERPTRDLGISAPVRDVR